METEFQQHHYLLHEHQPQHPQQPVNSGLTRYRSAPSSYFRSLTDREFCDQFFNRPSSPETERIFKRFMTSDGDDGGGGGGVEDSSHNVSEVQKNAPVSEVNQQTEYVNNEIRATHQQGNVKNYPSASSTPGFYQGSMKPPLPNQGLNSGSDGSGSMGVDLLPRMKSVGVRNSNLIRQSSSPVGLFNSINIDKGYAALRCKGNFGTGSSFNEEASFSSTSRLKNFSPMARPPHSSGLVSSIAEVENQSIRENPDNKGFAESHTNDYSTSFPVGSWDESAVMSDDIVERKVLEDNDDDEKAYSSLNLSDTQKVDLGSRPPMLAHHLSLPNTSAEMNAIEKILQFSDSVPCKLRAKRGCATHPRSIAERVRRTKISERMRKLQELVPNMDKQTNTSDMLDLAVDYIKDLQKQVQTLSDKRAKCKCSHGQQQ